MDKKTAKLIGILMILLLASYFLGYKAAESDYTKSNDEIIASFEEMIYDEDFPPFPLGETNTIKQIVGLYDGYKDTLVVQDLVSNMIRDFCRA